MKAYCLIDEVRAPHCMDPEEELRIEGSRIELSFGESLELLAFLSKHYEPRIDHVAWQLREQLRSITVTRRAAAGDLHPPDIWQRMRDAYERVQLPPLPRADSE